MIPRMAMPLTPNAVLIDCFTSIGSGAYRKASPTKLFHKCESTICIGCPTGAAVKENTIHRVPENHAAS
jgi:hypothetical protein